MGLAVIQPGLFTTVQDLGRPGWQAFGVPVGGAFDAPSARLANALLGNPPGAAVLELTLSGGRFEAQTDLALALTGASFRACRETPCWDLTDLKPPLAFSLEAGEHLVLPQAVSGARGYLATLGGWLTPETIGSRSSEVPLMAGDQIPCQPGWTPTRHLDPSDNPFLAGADDPIRLVPGPDIDSLDRSQLDPDTRYLVLLQSNRMGLRLGLPHWPVVQRPDRVSTPVAPGAVQATGASLLVLGVACGTMGGYPHVAHVISADMPRLAQLVPGDRVRFEWIGIEEARRLDREMRLALKRRLDRISTAAGDLIQVLPAVRTV